MSYKGSQVFYPYRTVGLYTSAVPFALQKTGTVHFATVPVQNTYQCDKLKVVAVGEQFDSSVKVLAVNRETTFVGVGNDIHVCLRAKKVSTLSGHTGKVSILLVMGEYLLSYSNQDKTVKVWNYGTGTECSSFELPAYYDVSSIMHPDTYLNKILIGTKQGPLYLWNFRTKKLIHTFDGWESAVTTVVQSPAVDVVAIGLNDGRIVMHNLKLDKILFAFRQVGKVLSMSFRTDGHNFLVSATEAGNLAIWNLDKRVLVTQYQNAHRGGVTSLQFFDREPLLLSSGQDNSVKLWIFDQQNGEPRLLRQRSGHGKPPTKVSFWMRSSQLLSSAQDGSLRYLNINKDEQSREFSQGSLESQSNKTKRDIEELRLDPIPHFSASTAKLGRWDNILSCHRGSQVARSWNSWKWVLGTHHYRSTDPQKPILTATAVSACGNFGILGAKSGWIDKFNLQSGLHRGTYGGKRRHKAEITGLEITQLNNVLISSSLDGTIKLWDFQEGKLIHTIEVGMPVTMIQLNKETNLLAAVGDDFNLRIYDCSTRTLVRLFKGHQTAISALAFSNSARWLVTASGMDREVRVWDVPSGRCIDWFLTHSPVTSLAVSPKGDFLATSHAGERGIYLWANAMYFSNIFLKPLPPKPTLITLPTLSGTQIDEDEESEEEKMDAEEELWQGYEENKEQLHPDMITFSGLPKSVCNTLVNLDTIKERNKSKETEDVPKPAPFILSSTLAEPRRAPVFTNVQAKKDDEAEASNQTTKSRILDFSKLKPKTKFVAMLEKASAEQNCMCSKFSPKFSITPVMEFLKSASPSAVDFELRSLSEEDDGEELSLALELFKHESEANRNFELVQAYMNIFYKAHWEYLQTNKELLAVITQINETHKKQWKELVSLFDSNLCLLNYFGDAFST